MVLIAIQVESICLSASPSVHVSVCSSVRLSLRLSVHPIVWPSARLSIRPSVHPFVYPSVHLYIHPSVSTSFLVSVVNLMIFQKRDFKCANNNLSNTNRLILFDRLLQEFTAGDVDTATCLLWPSLYHIANNFAKLKTMGAGETFLRIQNLFNFYFWQQWGVCRIQDHRSQLKKILCQPLISLVLDPIIWYVICTK